MNQVRGLLSEYGVVAPQGLKAFVLLLAEVTDPQSESVSAHLKIQFRFMLEEYHQFSGTGLLPGIGIPPFHSSINWTYMDARVMSSNSSL